MIYLKCYSKLHTIQLINSINLNFKMLFLYLYCYYTTFNVTKFCFIQLKFFSKSYINKKIK